MHKETNSKTGKPYQYPNMFKTYEEYIAYLRRDIRRCIACNIEILPISKKIYCDNCKKAHKKLYNKNWQIANSERVRANHSVWRDANREHVRAQAREYMRKYVTVPENRKRVNATALASLKRRRKIDPEPSNKIMREYYRRNCERLNTAKRERYHKKKQSNNPNNP